MNDPIPCVSASKTKTLACERGFADAERLIGASAQYDARSARSVRHRHFPPGKLSRQVMLPRTSPT